MSRSVAFAFGLRVIGVGLVAMLSACSSLYAQYPALPAESTANANYEWRPDLGGWRDKTTNLVWGYSNTAIANFTNTYAGAKTSAQNYPQIFPTAAQDRLNRAQLQEDRAALETDPVRKQGRLDLAAKLRAEAEALRLAGIDAAKFSNWRVPTLAEFRSAYSKGLFSRGTPALNFDSTPAPGYQALNGVPHWTADAPTNGGRLATAFNPQDGGFGQVGVGSAINLLVVRSGP